MFSLFKSKIAISGLIIVVLGIGGYFAFFRHGAKHSFVAVKRGAITESVSLTGNTAPAQSVSLAFGASGIVARTNSDLGERVHAGDVLAELNTNDLAAGVKGAEANEQIRSEEHTSELQSPDHLLCPLLLEKKK